MKNFKIKLLTLGVLATVVMSSTPAFADTNTNTVPTNTINVSNTESVSKTPAIPGTVTASAIKTSADYLWYYNYSGGDRPTQYVGCNSRYTLGIQRYLNAEGFNAGAEDGIFGAQTKAAVIRLQQCTSFKGYGLEALSADGIVGPYTYGKIGCLLNWV